MGLFDRLKKDEAVDFSTLDSLEKAAELFSQGVLETMYIMPPRFNGKESARNRLLVPPAVVARKDQCDDMVEKLLMEGKVNGYDCVPEYEGDNIVPRKIEVIGYMDGQPVYSETIQIW